MRAFLLGEIMSLYTLTVDLLAKTGSFERDMGKAARIAERDSAKMAQSFKAVGVAMGAAFGTAVSTATIAIRAQINAMDEMSKAAQRANVPTDKFSELAYAAGLADVSMQDLTGAMGKLAKAQGDAEKATSTQAKLFKALGIETKALDGSMRPTNQLLEDFADRFKDLKGSPEIMAAGMNIFGRSFQTLIPLIKDGSQGLRDAGDEAKRYGLVLSEEAGANAEAFNDNLTRMGAIARGFTQQVTSELLPRMVELSGSLTDVTNEGSAAIAVADGLGRTFDIVAGNAQGMAAGVRAAAITMAELVHQSTAWYEIASNIATWGVASGTVKEGWAKSRRGGDQWASEMGEQWDAFNAGLDRVWNGSKATARPADSQAPKEWKDQLAAEKEAQNAALRNAMGNELKAAAAAAAAAKAAEQRIESLARYDKQAAMAAATLAGPLQAAEMAHTQRLAEIDAELKKGNMSQAAANVLRDEATAALEKTTAALREQQNAPNALLDTMTGEIRLLGMTGRARELYRRQLENERDMREAINRANEAGAGINDEVTASLLRQARGWAETSIAAEEAAAAAESWTRVAMDAVGGVADVFADLFSGQLKSAKDFFTSLKDVFKRGLWDVMRNMMQANFVAPMQKALESAMSGFGNAGTSGQGFGSVLSKAFSSWLGQGAGAANVATTGYGQAINGLAQTYGGTGVGSAAGAGMAGLGAAIPIAGAIIAGMTLNNAAYAQGFKIQGQTNNVSEYLVKNGHAILALAHSTVSVTDKMLQKIGLSSKTASMISGSSLSTKAFGHAAPKIQQSGIQGSVGFGGFDGESFADIKAKGGWFRSDKRWTETGDVNPQIDRAFAMAGARAGVGARELAKQVGVDVAQALSSVKIDLGKMVLDADPEKAREQVEAKLSEIMEGLTGEAVKALGFGSLLEPAFAATDVMTALSAAMELSRTTAEALGRAINDTERAGIERAVGWFKELSQINGTEMADEIARVVGVVGDYGSLMADVSTQLMTGGLSNYQAQALAIERTYRQQTKSANDYAKALGLSGARAEDLAKIEELRAVGMGKLQAQMEAEKAASLNNLALSDLSPLRDDQKLAEAMKQLQDAVTAGDIGAANSASQAALGFGRNLYASGKDYNALYQQVTGMIGGMQLGDLALEDGTTMGELADTLEALPEQFGKAIFELAAGMQKETTAATNEVRDAVNRGNALLEQVLEETRKGVAGGSSGRLREELNRQVAAR